MIEIIFSGLGGTIIGAWLVFACDKYRFLKNEHKEWAKSIIKWYEASPDELKKEWSKNGTKLKADMALMYDNDVINFDDTTWYKSWWQMIKCLVKPF